MEPGSPRVLAPRRPVRRRRRWPAALAAVVTIGAIATVVEARPDGRTTIRVAAATTTSMSTTTIPPTTTSTEPVEIPTTIAPPALPPPAFHAAAPLTTTTTTRPAPPPSPPPPPSTTSTTSVPKSSPDVDARDDSARVNGDLADVDVLHNDLPRAGMLDPDTLAVEIEPPVGTTKVHDGKILYRGPPNVRFWYRICSTTGGCGYAAVTIYPANA